MLSTDFRGWWPEVWQKNDWTRVTAAVLSIGDASKQPTRTLLNDSDLLDQDEWDDYAFQVINFRILLNETSILMLWTVL